MSLFHRRKNHDDGLDGVQWSEADKALARSRHEAAKVTAEWPKVEQVSEVLTKQLEQNNFAERIRLAFTPRGVGDE